MKRTLPSSKLLCRLDIISICVKAQNKQTSIENATLWLQQKPHVVWAESNWSFAVKDVYSIELEETREHQVLKLECQRKEKVWIGENVLSDEKCMTVREQHEQRKRRHQVQKFFEVVNNLVEKRKSKSFTKKQNPGMRKSPPSLSSRGVVKSKFISPTHQNGKMLTKRKQAFSFSEFSSEDEGERKVNRLASLDMEDVNPPCTHREMRDSVKDRKELEKPFVTNRNVSDESDCSSIETHICRPQFSNQRQKQRKRLLVLQDDDDALDDDVMEVNDSFSNVLAHATVEETRLETTLERTKKPVIENCIGAHDESPGSGILAFLKPKKSMPANPEGMVSPNKFPPFNESEKLVECENSAVKENFYETENLDGPQHHTADVGLENTSTEEKNLVITTSMQTKLQCDERSILEPQAKDNFLENYHNGCPRQELKFKPKPFKLRTIRSYQRARREDCESKDKKEWDVKQQPQNGFNALSICKTDQINSDENQSLKLTEHQAIHVGIDSPTSMVGLRNMGNMCYINAALQMLSSLQLGFVNYFLAFCAAKKGAKKMSDVEVSSPRKQSGAGECVNNTESISLPLHYAIAEVLYSLQSSPPLVNVEQKSITSSRNGNGVSASASCVKRAIDLKTNNFYGNEQRDAHEFLLEILDLLDEEEKQDEITEVFHPTGSTSRLVTPNKEFERSSPVLKMLLYDPGSDSSKVQNSTTEKPKLPIEQYFKCEVEVTLVCDMCGYSRTNVELYRHLSLDLAEGAEQKDPWSLTKGIENFFKPHTVSVKCDRNRCGGESCTKSHRVTNLPGALLLHLKRFEFKTQELITDKSVSADIAYLKKKNLVKYPASLSLSKYYVPLEDTKTIPTSSAMYELRSIVHHIGDSTSRGHYITDALKTIPSNCGKTIKPSNTLKTPQITERWIRFDDAVIKPISVDVALSEPESMRNVYMLLYERGPRKLNSEH